MRFDEPGWWYAPEGRAARVLGPFGALYGAIAVQRFNRAKAYRSALPVICVGNFTAGGTGKTPLTRFICQKLAARGESPAVLTRGYGGNVSGPHWVDATLDRADQVGDEPLLIARDAAVLIARDRAVGARVIEALGKHTVIVMDDGLQNPGLAKDLVIAVIDGRRGFGNGRVIPAGPLRAPLAFQFEIAHALVINAGSRPAEGESKIATELRSRFPGPVIEARVLSRGAGDAFSRRSIVAYAGIAAPERFFDLLAGEGATIVERIVFPDHHVFTSEDAARLLSAAAAHEAELVTTEKDHVRLQDATGELAELGARTRTLPISLTFDANSEARLTALIDAALAAKRT